MAGDPILQAAMRLAGLTEIPKAGDPLLYCFAKLADGGGIGGGTSAWFAFTAERDAD